MVQGTYKHCISHTNAVFLACITGIIFSNFFRRAKASAKRLRSTRHARQGKVCPPLLACFVCTCLCTPEKCKKAMPVLQVMYFYPPQPPGPMGISLRRLNCILQGVPLQSDSTAIDRRTECHGFDDWGHTNTKALKILDYRNCYWLDLCRAQMTT